MKHTPEERDALVRRLNNGGCPVLRHHGYKVAPVGLAIEPIAGPSGNQLFTIANGGTGYEIELWLRNESSRAIDVVDFQIKMPWGIPKICLLPAPRKSSPRYPHYSFPEPGPYAEGGFVLNPFFARSKSRLNPAKELEGVLLASSEEPIPAEVAHRSRVIATLVIFDSRGNAFSGRFLLPVVREEVVIREYKNLVRGTKARQHEKVELTHPLVAPPAPKEPSEQEKQVLVATLGRFCEDMARISKR